MEVLEERETSHVIIQHLKATGFKIKRWKASLSEQQEKSAPPRVGLFGIPLQELPLSECDGAVPQFLVDACHFLSQHLHTEGLFRKSGSMTRIKALKVKLESGERCWDSALPCDVASLLKQFLRDLPDPLIITELQEPLCRIQQLAVEDEQGPITALITCLLPRLNACTLRYFCTFLQRVASRCDENKMDLGNLSLVFAPNLFRNLEVSEKLTGITERQLQLQVAVVQTLVTHASEIGRLPQFILEKLRPLPDPVSVCHTPTEPECGEDLPAGRRRRHRQSMGEMVNGALSKLMTGRTPVLDRKPAATPEPSPAVPTSSPAVSTSSPTLSTSFKTKRKVSEDAAQGPELSAKKRKASLEPIADEILTGHMLGLTVSSSKVPSPPHAAQGSSIELFSQSPTSPGRLMEQSLGVQSQPAMPHLHPPSSTKRRRSKRTDGKRVQRKHSGRNSSCSSPVIIDRKDQVRKSLRLFQRPGKPQSPLYPLASDAKGLEPSGWNLMKRMVVEAFEGPIFTGRDLRSTPRTDELPNGASYKSVLSDTLCRSSSAGEEAAVCSADGIQRMAMPETGRKSRKTSPSLASAAEFQSSPTWRRWFTARDGKAGGIPGDPQLSGTQVLQEKSKPRPLRRSLSLPDSVSETVGDEHSKALHGSVLESPIFQEYWGCRGSPGCGTASGNTGMAEGELVGDAEAAISFRAQPGCANMETQHSVHCCLQLVLPLVHVTLANQGSLVDSESSILEDSEMVSPQSFGGVGWHTEVKVLGSPSPPNMEYLLTTDMSESDGSRIHVLSEEAALNKSVQNLSQDFHCALIEPSGTPPKSHGIEEGQRVLRRQGARRFGRSLSHESVLALRAEAAGALDTDDVLEGPDESPCQVEGSLHPLVKGSPGPRPTKSPLNSQRNNSRQIFVSRKHITLTFGGRRAQKEDCTPTLEVLGKNPLLQKPTSLCPENLAAGPESTDPSWSSSEAASRESLAHQFRQKGGPTAGPQNTRC